jgi:hypothetical protein
MLAYILPFSGVLLGALIALVIDNHKAIAVRLLLSFSGAFLLALSLFELLPEVYQHLPATTAGVLIMLGILLQIILEFFSKGVEHGHVHMNEQQKGLPVLLFVSLGIHSFLEGFPIHSHETMMYGVLVHKVPIALLLTVFMLKTKQSKLSILSFIFIFASLTPLGTYCSSLLSISENVVFGINAVVVGIFFHISTTIIFESGEGHKFNLTKLIAIVAGVAAAFLI